MVTLPIAAGPAIAAAAGADVETEPFRPVLRGVILTGRGMQWMRQPAPDNEGEGEAARHALFWPPTKVAGRYLAPFLLALDASQQGADAAPDGQPVELDLEQDALAASDALDQADRQGS